jgi:hypothetical protein
VTERPLASQVGLAFMELVMSVYNGNGIFYYISEISFLAGRTANNM